MKMVSNLLVRVPPLFNDLAKILQGDIDCSHETLARYSVDGSPYEVFPQAVIFPKNATDIKHVLSFAREYTMPITVRGSGTSGNGGSLGEGIILDMSRYFNHVRNVNMVENTVVVDVGVTISSLIERLRGWHFDIPLLIGNTGDEGTVGGLLATKSATGSSFKHGTIREWVESLTVIVDNGEEHHIADGITPSGRLLGIYQAIFPLLSREQGVIRAAKPDSHDDATGYNIWSTSIGPRQLIDQLIGSEGTLGIITSVTLRISPRKPHSITTLLPVSKREHISTYVDIAKRHSADHMFLYNETFMELSERYHSTLLPFFTGTPYSIAVTHSSNDKEKLHHTVKNFISALPLAKKDLIAQTDSLETISRITTDTFLFSLYTSYTGNTLIPISVGNGIIIPIHHLPQFLLEAETYLDSTGRLYTITGNIGSGHLSIVSLFDPSDHDYSDHVLFYTRNIFALVKKYDGGISAERGEGLTRSPYLPVVYSEAALLVFEQIKTSWDPLSILNPGKKGGITKNYLREHERRKN